MPLNRAKGGIPLLLPGQDKKKKPSLSSSHWAGQKGESPVQGGILPYPQHMSFFYLHKDETPNHTLQLCCFAATPHYVFIGETAFPLKNAPCLWQVSVTPSFTIMLFDKGQKERIPSTFPVPLMRVDFHCSLC